MNFEERVTAGGIIHAVTTVKNMVLDPRWAEVYVQITHTDVKVGQWVYVEHGRWTRGVNIEDDNGEIFKIRKVDPESILLVSDDIPEEI